MLFLTFAAELLGCLIPILAQKAVQGREADGRGGACIFPKKMYLCTLCKIAL